MSYCQRMKRPCACGRMYTYDRRGQVTELDNGTHCLTDREVRSALTALLQEWQRRFGSAVIETAQAYARLQ